MTFLKIDNVKWRDETSNKKKRRSLTESTYTFLILGQIHVFKHSSTPYTI